MDPYLKMLMAMESGGQNIINHSGATSATGLYGFTKPAFEQVRIDNPNLRGVTWEQFQQTPDIQHQFAAKLKDSVVGRMSNKGIPVTPLNVYKYWFMGPSGAENFLNKPPNTPLSQAMSPEAIAANPWVNKFQTVGGLSAELDRRIGQKTNMETPAQQTAQPSFAQLEAALAKARTANNQVAVDKLSNMLREPLSQARNRALEAGNEAAANKIIQRMQALGFDPTTAAPATVAPPGPVETQELPPLAPGAAPMGTPTQAPDFDPSQRDMGGLGTQAAPAPAPMPPAAAPEAPVAPQAPQVAPTPQLSPAAAPAAPVAAPAPRSTADIVSGGTTPVVTAPTAPKPLTDQQLATDPKWISNAKKLYQETNRKPFSGSDADAADWLKSYMANSKHNLVAGAGTILDLTTRMTPEGKQAFLDSYKSYDQAPTSGESVWRAVQAIATDPTTYATAGVGNILTKTIGKKAMEKAVARAAMEGVTKQSLSSATKRGLATGAGYGATADLIDQGQQIAAGGQESIDPTKLALSTGIGSVTGGAINKLTDSAMGLNAVRQLGRKAGSPEDVLTNAEIIQKIAREAGAPARANLDGLPKLQRKEVNARITGDIVREARDIVKSFPNDSPNKAKLLEAAGRGVNNSQRELEELAQIPGGADLVNVINKAIRADRLTAPTPASQNFLVKGTRFANDWVLPLPGAVSKPLGYLLKPRGSSEDVVNKLINKFGPAAEKITNLGFESSATTSVKTLKDMAQEAAAASTARRAALAAENSTKQTRSTAAKVPENPNVAISDLQAKDPTYMLGLSSPFGPSNNETQIKEFSNVIKRQMESRVAKEQLAKEAAARAKGGTPVDSRNSVLQATGMPLGGPFQELLQGGRSGLNLTSDQAIEALRIAAQKNKGNPVGEAANQVRRSSPEGVTDTNAFYGLQNELRKLQERGVLGGQPGALSAGTQASGIRNPISYAANVRTAEAALKVAQESAPSNALAQFANVVAGLKSPEAKAALVQQRLIKATDQAEIDFLTNFIEPLTRFGAKSK